jgi:hypothetical protein
LDSLDAIVAIASNASDYNYKKVAKGPRMTTGLTVGLLSIHACKDSFGCFTGTVGELQAKLTALTDEDIEALRKESPTTYPEDADDSSLPNKPTSRAGEPASIVHTVTVHQTGQHNQVPQINPLGAEKDVAKSPEQDTTPAFLLDGYDWTSIDHDPLPEPEIPPGDEQVALWYDVPKHGTTESDTAVGTSWGFPGRIIPQHFPLQSIMDPLSDGDMGALHYAGKNATHSLKSRLLVHKLTLKVRFFDGYDWPEKLDLVKMKAWNRQTSFAIEPEPKELRLAQKKRVTDALADKVGKQGTRTVSLTRKTKLLADLLGNEDEETPTTSATFERTPLPEERAANIEHQAELRRLSRKTHLFFQISANGVTLRMDSFEKSESHRLVSILSLSVSDLFLAETASHSNPIKMLGEWINENEHPRDTRFGTLMMKVSPRGRQVSFTPLLFLSTGSLNIITALLPIDGNMEPSQSSDRGQ